MALQWAIMNTEHLSNDANEFRELTVPTFQGPHCLCLEGFGNHSIHGFELQKRNQAVLITHNNKKVIQIWTGNKIILNQEGFRHVKGFYVNWKNTVGIATRYGLDSHGIISWLEQDFPDSCRPELRPTQPPVQWVLGHSRWVKWAGHSVDHPHPSSATVKERLELYLYSPLGLHGLFQDKRF